jgi:hypothetical protein
MKREISWRRIGIGLGLAVLVAAIVLAFSVVSTRLTRLALASAIAALVAGVLVLSWKRRWVFSLMTGLILAGLAFVLLPGRTASENLRTQYIRALASYSGSPYVWGGESRRGIDCSGLPRRSLQDALVREGLLTLNPAMIRLALDLWWNDTTAQSIGDGYEGRTRMVTQCRTLNTLDHSLLQPGDMAVTTSGGHMLAYLGNNRWIEADPLDLRVLEFAIPEPKNAWFSSPMKIVRWRVFEG